jgi:hypothetical protein
MPNGTPRTPLANAGIPNAALYHHARGTPPKRLFWVAVPSGRWRIDWQRTNRGS